MFLRPCGVLSVEGADQPHRQPQTIGQCAQNSRVSSPFKSRLERMSLVDLLIARRQGDVRGPHKLFHLTVDTIAPQSTKTRPLSVIPPSARTPRSRIVPYFSKEVWWFQWRCTQCCLNAAAHARLRSVLPCGREGMVSVEVNPAHCDGVSHGNAHVIATRRGEWRGGGGAWHQERWQPGITDSGHSLFSP